MMRRDDPKTHVFIPPCGQMEGHDSCWLCAKTKSEHLKNPPVAEQDKEAQSGGFEGYSEPPT
jgi:hypothetical protein